MLYEAFYRFYSFPSNVKGSSAVFWVCLLVALLSGVAIASAVTGGSDGTDSIGIAEVEEEIDPDDVMLSIEVDADGDAVWTIEYRTRLDSDDDEAAFDDLQSDIENDPDSYLDPFSDRMEATAADAGEFTDREMTVSEFGIDSERVELPREYGIVRYTFRWSNFAAVDGDRLSVGDAIDGMFLDDASELRIAWDDEYGLVEANPEPTESGETSVTWRGPTTFAEGEPRVTLDPTVADDPDDGAGVGDENGGLGGDDMPSGAMLAVLGVVILFLSLGYGVKSGRLSPPGWTRDGDGTDTDGMSADEGSEAAGVPAESASSEGADGAEGSADSADAGASEEPTISEEAADPDPFASGDRDLLSNEERVMRLIEAHGGRMKQKRVAEELDWTAAKTSQVTKKLREDGDLVGFRLGRENVLTLPEEDPR